MSQVYVCSENRKIFGTCRRSGTTQTGRTRDSGHCRIAGPEKKKKDQNPCLPLPVHQNAGIGVSKISPGGRCSRGCYWLFILWFASYLPLLFFLNRSHPFKILLDANSEVHFVVSSKLTLKSKFMYSIHTNLCDILMQLWKYNLRTCF